MSWSLLLALVLALGIALAALLLRRAEIGRMQRLLAERERARRTGSAQPSLQHPSIDLSRCLGCGACVRACPEEGVLELVHGQALVVHAARCNGVAACERSCPVGAIQVRLSQDAERRDLPALHETLEAVGTPGLFLAGEVTALARIATAVQHGSAVAREVAARVALARAPGLVRARERVPAGAMARTAAPEPADDEPFDLVIVGAGPAGLACALEARRSGLSHLVLEQEAALGGTVAKYPRRKLVLTEPVELPGGERLERASYEKEELVELWKRVAARAELAIETGVRFDGLERDARGHFRVRSSRGDVSARHVCLAIGRRGLPRRLGIPGEDLPKLAYSLLDAQAYQGRRLLVVGGGDSAVEAALALAEQPGNEVVLAHRGEHFPRLRARVDARLRAAVEQGRIEVRTTTRLCRVAPDSVELEHARGRETLANDEVFVFAGGQAPLELLQRCGVSFDPALRPAPAPVLEQGTGLVRALAASFVLALVALGWALAHADYYLLPREARVGHDAHALLRPGAGLGLGLGIAAALLVAANLGYLARRSARGRRWPGSLQGWMSAHVATGFAAVAAAMLHSAMSPGDSLGGHALALLGLLLVTGALGRYVYAWVPRAANGRELELAEARLRLERLQDALDPGPRAFVERVRRALAEELDQRRWRGGTLARLAALLVGQRELARVLRRLADEGRREGLDPETIRATLALARGMARTALAVGHWEDLRGLLASWRWFHRWMAVLLVALLVLHVAYAWLYGGHLFEGGSR